LPFAFLTGIIPVKRIGLLTPFAISYKSSDTGVSSSPITSLISSEE
jgi:hypothetical protein